MNTGIPDKEEMQQRRRLVSRRAFIAAGLGVVALPILAACTPSSTATPTPTTAAKGPGGTPMPTTGATSAITPAAGTPAATAMSRIGGTVSVLATWGGAEQDSFLAMVKPFEDQTGVKIEYTGTRDINAVLSTRVQGGNPPDVAGLPGPGQMAQFAKQGKLVDLSSIIDLNAMKQDYDQAWIDLGTVNGKFVGIFIKSALKGLIWYSPPNFQSKNYQVPKTWDDTMALANQIANGGVTPWSIGLESGAASGWPGTDWLEDILLRQAGPKIYDDWYNGKQKWSSAEVKKAWQTWGQIATVEKMVYGGKQYELSTNFGDAATPLFQSPPKAYLHHQASFITDFIVKANPNAKPIQDFNFFAFPDIDPANAGAGIAAGDLFGMFKDTPQARALMQYLVTAPAQAIWVKRGGALSPNKRVTESQYPDDLSRQLAKALLSVKTLRFDGSDMMPDQMNTAFFKACLDYVSNPGNLDSILSSLDGVQAQAYQA
ncbi:MAG: ABC transporter substrate-binding protein [Chloroflexota bacterium]